MNTIPDNALTSPIHVKNGADKDRNNPVFSELTAPDEFDDDRCNENVDLFCESPWIYLDALADNELVTRYAMDGLLHGDIPVSIVVSIVWIYEWYTAPGIYLYPGLVP